MDGLISHIGAVQFAQIIVKCWNECFILFLLYSMLVGRQDDKRYQVINSRAVLLTKELTLFYISVLIYNLSDIFVLIFGGRNSSTAYYIVRIGTFAYYASCAGITQFLLKIIRKYIADKHGLRGLRRVIIAVQAVQYLLYAMLISNRYTGIFYQITEDNRYERSRGFPIWQLTTIITYIFIICVTVLEWKRIYSFLAKAVITAAGFHTVAMIVSLNMTYNLNSTMASFAALILFTLHEQNKKDSFIRSIQELEKTQTELERSNYLLEQSKNQLLIAQIQPHFINNSLMTLCARSREYPDVYEGLKYFSMYLRSHFDILSEESPITFEQEMDNIEAYLTLERMNYKDKLQVDYNIMCDDFMVPALSVQPLVENAVRHGISRENGGTVGISSFRKDGYIVIEVKDDGTGDRPDIEKNKERRGVGLENIIKRLDLVCGGRLELMKVPDGTVARITIKEESGDEKIDNAVG